MSNPAVALQASPGTLPRPLQELQQRIEAAIAPQDWRVRLSCEGNCLEVILQGSICPDPLLSLMLVEGILTSAAMPGMVAARLLGYELGQARLGWMGLVELGAGQGKGLAQRPWRASEREAWEASAQDCRLDQQRWSETSPGEHTLAQEAPDPDPIAQSLAYSQAQVQGQSHLQAQSHDSLSQVDDPQVLDPPRTPALALTNGFDTYRAFIANESSWFSEAVKANSALHELAKSRQHYALRTLSHYLVDQLRPGEILGDVLPVQMGDTFGSLRRDRGGALIITDQRAIALSQRELGAQLALEVWMVPWAWVYKVEVTPRALRLRYGKSTGTFQANLTQPNRLLRAIPRDVPTRRLEALPGRGRPHLATVPGLALIAGIMFTVGSVFSGLSREPMPRLARQSGPSNGQSRLGLSQSANALGRRPAPEPQSQAQFQSTDLTATDDSSSSNSLSPTPRELRRGTQAAATTNDPTQCLESFNDMAQSHAYATLNQVTQTLQIKLENNRLKTLPQSEFNQVASAVAQEVLASCQAPNIDQVQISNGLYRYRQERSALPLPAAPEPASE